MDFNFSTPNTALNNQWGVGNPNFGFGNPTDYSSMNAWGVSPGMSGALNPLTGNTSDKFAMPNNGSPAIGSAAGSFGLNVPTFQLGLGAISTLGNLWGAYNAQSTAKDALDFQKNMSQKNLTNSIASYNTALSDRATARGVTEGQSSAQVQDYINKNKLAG